MKTFTLSAIGIAIFLYASIVGLCIYGDNSAKGVVLLKTFDQNGRMTENTYQMAESKFNEKTGETIGIEGETFVVDGKKVYVAGIVYPN